MAETCGFTPRRVELIDGLTAAAELLVAAGCPRLWIVGSLATAKPVPRDFDAVWSTDGVELDRLDPVLLDIDPPRAAQKLRFGGELLPNVAMTGTGHAALHWFMTDRDDVARGVIQIELEGTSP